MTTTEALQHAYVPRGAAKELFAYRGRQVLLCGPAGTGKSRACLEKGLMLALLNPGSRGLLLRKTLTSLTATGLVTFEKKVALELIASGGMRFWGSRGNEPAQYVVRTAGADSTITIGGMDNPEKIMSGEYDWIFVQEATEFSEDEWEKCTSRLRNGVISFQQLMADCNPSVPHHWLNRRCSENKTKMFYSVHKDNPVYYDDDGNLTPAGDDYINGVLGELTGVRRIRLFEGKWAAAEGLVYDGFDPAVHIVDGLPKGAEGWTRFWSVDFGYRNPFVCQFWAKDPDGALWLYREIYQTGVLVEDHAKHILSVVRPNGAWIEPKPRSIVCDHDAEDRATLERHLGMSTVAADKRKKVGIETCQARYKVDPRGKTGFYFVRDAVVARDPSLVSAGKPSSTLDELPGYCWPEGVKPAQREEPVKEDDHGADAMRYVAMEAEHGGVPKMRFV